MPISGDAIHTVTFFQGAFTIILSLSLGEALRSFVSDNPDHAMRWERVPAILAFLFAFFPFFQSMSQYLYVAYLDPDTALKFHRGYLAFDGLMFTFEAGCFFVMSRSLAPQVWRRFYSALLALMAVDIGWTGVNSFRNIHVGDWLWVNIGIVAAILVLMWLERGKAVSTRPVYVGLAVIAVATATSYWLERDMYFP